MDVGINLILSHFFLYLLSINMQGRKSPMGIHFKIVHISSLRIFFYFACPGKLFWHKIGGFWLFKMYRYFQKAKKNSNLPAITHETLQIIILRIKNDGTKTQRIIIEVTADAGVHPSSHSRQFITQQTLLTHAREKFESPGSLTCMFCMIEERVSRERQSEIHLRVFSLWCGAIHCTAMFQLKICVYLHYWPLVLICYKNPGFKISGC